MRFDGKSPICDGISYSDLWRISDQRLQQALCARGLVYATQFCDEYGVEWGGDIICGSWSDAKRIAFSRGLGEKITFKIDEFHPAEA